MSMPTGHPWLHGATRSWYTGRLNFHEPVCVTSVDVRLIATEGMCRSPVVSMMRSGTGNLPCAHAPHGMCRFGGGGDVLLELHRHFLANRVAHRGQVHQAGVGGESAKNRGVHDRLGSGTETVADGDAGGVDGGHAKMLEQLGEILGRAVRVDEDVPARLEPGRHVNGPHKRGVEDDEIVGILDLATQENGRVVDPEKRGHRCPSALDAEHGERLYLAPREKGCCGQGTVIASKLLAVALFLEGRQVQSFPMFG